MSALARLFLIAEYRITGESKLIAVSQLLVKHTEDTVKQLHVVLIDNCKVLLDIHIRYIVTPHMVQSLVDIRLGKLHHIS